MAGGLQILKKRIKSIQSTRQVTKAMEAVSASKMRKAVAKALASRDYAGLGWEVVQRLAQSSDVLEHPLFVKREVKASLLIVYTSDRGLCGAMNAQLLRQVSKWMKVKQSAGVKVKLITIGKKGQNSLRRLGLTLDQTYVSLGDKPSSVALRPVASSVMQWFQSGEVDEVVVAYTDFKSSLTQVPTIKTLLPFSAAILETSGDVVSSGERAHPGASNTLLRASPLALPPSPADRNWSEYIFEPGQEGILNTLIPRLVEVQVFQALLESVASEQSSRMVAMRNATDAASDMINDLNLTYNQARQAGITQEIAEISAGRLALEN
ncbi:MAG: ATP synthase F1 subunit gamma [Patescibacteria group bacterium]